MNRTALFTGGLLASSAAILLLTTSATARQGGEISSPNANGVLRSISTNGVIDTSGPFFQDLGSNGRTCASCHVASEAWTITPEGVQRRFDATGGTDPIFRTNDGSNSPDADVSTVDARRQAYSMLLNKGLIRVSNPVPASAEFTLVGVDDPYGHANSADVSTFRRPLPSTNLRFISAVMWDGRETLHSMVIHPAGGEQTNRNALLFDLADQSNGATQGHAQRPTPLTNDVRAGIVNFEMGLFTAQSNTNGVGNLAAQGADGGPLALANIAQGFFIGINDNITAPDGTPLATPNLAPLGMTLYDAWANSADPHKQAVVRGQRLFNSRPMEISGVGGINDNPYFGSPATFNGSCTTCHNTPGSGNHSLAVALNIGLTDASRRTPDMPLYTLRNNVSGELKQTTDPGRALITGKWIDVGKFKGPVLRGLSSRAPYFHNGSAKDFDAVLDFYDSRFNGGATPHFTAQERSDLIAFLQTL